MDFLLSVQLHFTIDRIYLLNDFFPTFEQKHNPTIALNRSGVEQCNPEPLVPFQHGQRLLFQRCDKSADFLVFSHPLFFFRFECDVMFEYGGLELTAEAARFYTSGRARFTPPGGHILQ